MEIIFHDLSCTFIYVCVCVFRQMHVRVLQASFASVFTFHLSVVFDAHYVYVHISIAFIHMQMYGRLATPGS